MSIPEVVVFLGVNGTLSSAVINDIAKNLPSVHMIGFDVQPSTALPLSAYYVCDLASRSSIRRALDMVPYEKFRDIRLLICSAVMNQPTLDANRFDEETFYRGLQINLVGQAHFATDFTMRCIEADAKVRVIPVGSTAAYIGSADIGYSMAKAGLNGLVNSLSKYGATSGVTAMAVHTGIFESAMEASVSDYRKTQTIAATHVKRKATIDEVRDFVSFYLLRAPDFATGMCVDFNGGQHT